MGHTDRERPGYRAGPWLREERKVYRVAGGATAAREDRGPARAVAAHGDKARWQLGQQELQGPHLVAPQRLGIAVVPLDGEGPQAEEPGQLGVVLDRRGEIPQRPARNRVRQTLEQGKRGGDRTYLNRVDWSSSFFLPDLDGSIDRS